MKAHVETFKFGFKQITKDSMLILMIIAPFLCGIAFKFAIPILDNYISMKFKVGTIIEPYFITFDSFLVFLAPCLVCIVASFLILEELDDKVSPYIFVTPIGFSGYIFARLIIPGVFAFLLSFILITFFSLTKISVFLGMMLSVIATLYAIATTLVVVSVANNKVEGLAVTKLTGISFLGILAPTFVKGKVQYIFSVLPSFWIGKVALSKDAITLLLFTVAGICCSLIWIAVFYTRFKRKLG
jgi:fluoroquinolone transport system permease protein